LDGSQLVVTFEFDKDITLIGSPPYVMDDAIQVNNTNPIDAYQPAPAMIALVFENTVNPGAGWNINRTPQWCATPLAVSGGTVGRRRDKRHRDTESDSSFQRRRPTRRSLLFLFFTLSLS